MAERRMFSKTIIESDNFIDMPATAQVLYFHLCMAADDDGFVNGSRRIQRSLGSSDDDMEMLEANGYTISLDNGIIVITHWKIHNYIAKDRYRPTIYKDLADKLRLKEDKSYTLDTDLYTKCIHDVYVGKESIGKDSKGKDSIGYINKPKNTKFHNFKGREYDFEALEKEATGG